MNQGALHLDAFDLALAAALVLAAGLVSLVLKLSLERRLLWASTRTVLQLLAVGQVLGWVFHLEAPSVVLGLCVLMIAAAARASVTRASRRYRGAYLGSFLTLCITGAATSFVATDLIIGVEPFWKPQYLIPLLGMVLGNTLTGLSLSLDDLLRSLSDERAQVEADLSLGATRWQAARRPLRQAVRRGMIPILNSMSVVGIVSLPGMMTGQILQGADPNEAVRYQIVIMFMLAGATAFGSMFLALWTYRALFNERHQLRTELISEAS